MQPVNILTDDCIRIFKASDSARRVTLPEIYASLMADKVESLPALRPHQRHSLHAFLVQLGALAMHNSGVGDLPKDADEWLELLRTLTPEYVDDEPWMLVVDDLTKPAFMQPPASSSDRLVDYRRTVETADELDMLITSKNHDLKSAVATSGEVDDWVFALISLQTSEGFSGAGNYGVSRMNGGLGCRPAFSLTPTVRLGGHVRRDIETLLERRDRMLDDDLTHDGGVSLLWTEPWDGTKAEALSLSQLDPFYIETCRRIRLRPRKRAGFSAIRATSNAPRIDARAMKGITGDPWTPINRKESKSLTLSTAGFSYRRTAEYLTSADWERPTLFEPTSSERRSGQGLQLVARGMVRGQGKTEGYHERIVDLRPETVGAFGRVRGEQELGDIARARIDQVRTVQRILRHAVSVFAAGGSTNSVGDEHRARADLWAKRLDEIVDVDFFDALQEEFKAQDVEGRERCRHAWLRGVVDSARDLLRQAEDALPCPAIQRFRARAVADSVFEGRIRGSNGFPELFTEVEVDSGDRNDN